MTRSDDEETTPLKPSHRNNAPPLAGKGQTKVSGEAIRALMILTTIQLICYFHRYMPSALKAELKEDLHLTDSQTGMLFTLMLIMYIFVSPLVGALADRGFFSTKRKWIIAAGVLLWSIATSCTGFVTSYWSCLVMRVLFGAGEASFATLGAALLCDFFAEQYRNIALSIFLGVSLAGSAIGFTSSGYLSEVIGWRWTFVVLGPLGLVPIVLLIFIREPHPGESDLILPTPDEVPSTYDYGDEEEERRTATSTTQVKEREPQQQLFSNKGKNQTQMTEEFSFFSRAGLKQYFTDMWYIVVNASYLAASASYTMTFFATGAYSDWLNTFFERYYDMSSGDAGLLNGTIGITSCLLGTLVGSWLADKVTIRWTAGNPFFLVSGVAMTLASIFGIIAIFGTSTVWGLGILLFFCVFCGSMPIGPINALILNSVPGPLRSRANGISVLLCHLLGDAISPTIVGKISDQTSGDLRGALMVVPASMALAAWILLLAWICIPDKVPKSSPSQFEAKSLPASPSPSPSVDATPSPATTIVSTTPVSQG